MTHFNKSANEWDTPEKIILNEKYSETIKSLIPSKHPKKVLDLGCGTGLLISNFQNNQSTLIGVDTSVGMLEVFNKKFAGLSNVKSYLLNLEEESFSEGQFDLIISSMAFHHLKKPKQMIEKLRKLLSTEGVIAIIDLDEEDGSFHPDPKNMGVFHSGFSQATTAMWAKEAHFKHSHRKIIHTMTKNDKSYPIFLALYSDGHL